MNKAPLMQMPRRWKVGDEVNPIKGTSDVDGRIYFCGVSFARVTGFLRNGVVEIVDDAYGEAFVHSSSLKPWKGGNCDKR